MLYLSALCDEASQGKKTLHQAINALISPDDSGISESTPASTVQTENARADPLLLWRALYIQELTAVWFLTFHIWSYSCLITVLV